MALKQVGAAVAAAEGCVAPSALPLHRGAAGVPVICSRAGCGEHCAHTSREDGHASGQDVSDKPRWRRLESIRSVPAAMDAVRSLDSSVRVDLKRAVPAVVVMSASLIVGQRLGGLDRTAPARFVIFGTRFSLSSGHVLILVVGLALVFAVSGIVATRSIARELARVSAVRGGVAAASAIRLVCLIFGYGIVGLGLLALLQLNLGNLVVGGAVTGVIIGIAAQQTLGNFFAGLVLLFARPYTPGQRVTVRSGAMGGPFEGTIIDAGLMYTTIRTDQGTISLPNAGLLAAAIGPATEPNPPTPQL